MAVNLFLSTVLLSVTGSTAYLLLKLLSAAGGGRLSQSWRYGGAMTVSLLFALPFYKLWALFPNRPRVLALDGSGRIPSVSAAAGALPERAASAGGAVDWALVINWAAALWLLTAACLILWNVWRLLRYRRAIERSGGEVDGRLRRIARDAARLAGVAGEARLLASPLVQSPMLVGFFRPVVALPSERLPDADARYILTHELTHFRRGDLWERLLVNMIQCVHWFNPAVYLLSRDLAYWQETSCDEQVVSSLDHAQRKEYGYLLINYAPASRRAESKLYASFTSHRYKLKRRISIMMRSNKKSHPVLSRVLALALAAGCVTATSAFAAPLLPEVESEKPVSVSWDVISEGKYQVKTGVLEVDEKTGTKVTVRIVDVDGDGGMTYAYYPAENVEELECEFIMNVAGGYLLEDSESMTTTLISVSHADEKRFTPEKWAEILKMIDEGRVFWEDPRDAA